MTTENTENSTETLKTRKPRSPNKPKTAEKQAYLASKHVDRLNAKRDDAVEKAVKRVNLSFAAKVTDFLDSLSKDVRPLVTGVSVDEAVDTVAAAE
jgi:hypothetical protein